MVVRSAVIVRHTTVREQQPSGMKDQRLPVERSQETKLQLERSEPLLVLVRKVVHSVEQHDVLPGQLLV